MAEYIDKETLLKAFSIENMPDGVCRLGEIDAEYVRKVIENFPLARIEHSSRWIAVNDAMPEEHDSIFAKFYGTDKWDKNMSRKVSDECIVCCACEDGKMRVTTSWTKDGVFRNPYDLTKTEITHWMLLPSAPKEEV